MEWLESIRKSVEYIENNITQINGAEDLGEVVFMSSFYLQKGFKLMTGYTISEYIRNRKLYLAALDIVSGKQKVIDIALKYGYETPESFTKAFTRFHGVSPLQVKNDPHQINVFLPLRISINIYGGNGMDYRVEKMDSFKVIGLQRIFAGETGYQEIPNYWTEVEDKYVKTWWPSGSPSTECEKVFRDNCVGTYGVCIEDKTAFGKTVKANEFFYMIAGNYTGGTVPDGMVTYEIPARQWAKFKCVGPIPGSIQSINTKVFQEWLPGNPDWELDGGFNIEWYNPDECPGSPDYTCEIWLPVKPRAK